MNKKNNPSPIAAMEGLRRVGLTPESTVYYVVRANQQASQDLDFYVVTSGGRIARITWWLAGLLDAQYEAGKGMRVSGGGMSLALNVMNAVNRVMFGPDVRTSTPEEL